MTLSGQIDTIIYEKDNFFIARLKSGEKVLGNYLESDIAHLKDASITLEGAWEEHKKYGKTFRFESISANQGELFFFLTRIIKGFTKKLSAQLIEKFGEKELVNILNNDIHRLLEFTNIGEKRLAKIQDSWKKFHFTKELGVFLSPYGVSPTLLMTIATAMKNIDDPIEHIKNNPYSLTSINGIGFKRADELALKMGVEPKSDNRIGAAMDYALLNYCEQQGNSCVEKKVLFSLLDELLDFKEKENLYEATLIERVSQNSIVLMKNERVSPARLHYSENFLYRDFISRANTIFCRLKTDLDEFLKQSDLRLGDQQRNAVEIINNGAGILFLVGYAGTGKSTISRTILNLFDKDAEIMTCALSGIASQRIAETTGYPSSTIHSLLLKYEDKDKFPFSVLLIDEASMINSTLFARLIAKVKTDCVLIIVGDDAQLPPIGAGNVLSDCLTLEIAPIVKLTHIYRQSEDKAIALIANDIRQAIVPQYKQKYDDFEFIDVSIQDYYAVKNSLSQSEFSALREENSENILSAILHESLKAIEKARAYLRDKNIASYLKYFQVITPMKSGVLGTDNLNKVLQEYFNPNPKKFVRKGGSEFRLMDKVVHTKNEKMTTWDEAGFKAGSASKEQRVFNGMSGLLFRIDVDEEQAYVYYPNEDMVVLYEYEQLQSHLMLSYALTVHKVQGMEYDIVVIPITFSHYIMHNTKLIYTAITRAKHRCVLVGEGSAFKSACRRTDATKRDTVLLELKKPSLPIHSN